MRFIPTIRGPTFTLHECMQCHRPRTGIGSVSAVHHSMVNLHRPQQSEPTGRTSVQDVPLIFPRLHTSPSAENFRNRCTLNTDVDNHPRKSRNGMLRFHQQGLQTNSSRSLTQQRYYNKNTQHGTLYHQSEHHSDSENGYNQDEYAQELRRVQYGGGPAAELVLGDVATPRCDSHSKVNFPPDVPMNPLKRSNHFSHVQNSVYAFHPLEESGSRKYSPVTTTQSTSFGVTYGTSGTLPGTATRTSPNSLLNTTLWS